MNNADMEKIMAMLSKMDKKDLEILSKEAMQNE